MHRVDVDAMVDEMRPEQMLEWMAYFAVEQDKAPSQGCTDPIGQEAILQKAMGF